MQIQCCPDSPMLHISSFVRLIVMALKPICDMFLPSLRDTTMMQLVTRLISGSFLFFVAVIQTPERLFHQRRRIVTDRGKRGTSTESIRESHGFHRDCAGLVHLPGAEEYNTVSDCQGIH